MEDDDDKVGYKKPPAASRFKKGQSGNPKGRPRKVQPDYSRENLADTLERIGNEQIEVKGKMMTLRELEIRALMAKAAKGDVQAAKHLALLRKEAGLLIQPSGGGVLMVPMHVPLHEWSASAAIQQAKYRGEEPGNFEELKEHYAKGSRPSMWCKIGCGHWAAFSGGLGCNL